MGVSTTLQILSNPCLHWREQCPGPRTFLIVITFGFMSKDKKPKMKHVRSCFHSHSGTRSSQVVLGEIIDTLAVLFSEGGMERGRFLLIK